MNPSLPIFPAGPTHRRPAPGAASTATPLTAAQKLLLPLGVVLFDWLFWHEGGGVNTLLFTVFVVAAQLMMLPRHAAARRAGCFWLAVAGSLFGGCTAAVYGSAVAGLACVASVLLLLGYGNQPHLRLLVYALLTAVGSVAEAWLRVLRGVRAPRRAGAGVRRAWFYGRLLLVPVVILGAFHGLFAVANPRYAALSGRVLAGLGKWLACLLPEVSLGHVLFLVLGFGVVAGVLVALPVHAFANFEAPLGEFVQRQRDGVASLAVRRPDFHPKTTRTLDLRKEFVAAVAVFGLVNALLLVVNLIDINWLWFGFVPPAGFDLTQFVHEGTSVLIFSILLAMGIVLRFFRRNLNFYAPGLPWLRAGATAWVLQNAVLAASVGLRNYYYIRACGLAYKRIGVCFFLLLVPFGLGTVLLKIWQRRSAYSLVRLNSLAAYAVLLLLAAGNWEVWMARYNLQPRFQRVDIGFLLDMPGRVLPTLLARQAVWEHTPHLTLKTQWARPDGALDYGPQGVTAAEARRQLAAKADRWLGRYRAHADWQDKTWADWQAYRQLTTSRAAE